MAGGTGGHVFPALAVADYLEKRNWDVFWLGGTRGLEQQLVKLAPPRTLFIKFSGVRRNGILGWLLLPINLLFACLEVMRFFKKIKPDVVVGFGGYVSVPGGVAALLNRCPMVIHEQNAIPGLANRLLAKFSTKVLLGFPGSIGRGVYVGNPLRPEFENIRRPEIRYAEREGRLKILVVGGSLGAKAFNELLPVSISKIRKDDRPHVVHQAGRNKLSELQKLYDKLGVEATLSEFIEDIPLAYSQADLVISRAGALSVSEIAAVGVASILVPYPFAVDDHQTKNSEFLEKLGAAIIINEAKISADLLVRYLENFSRRELMMMGVKARLGRKQGASIAVGQHIEDLTP
jgi:UDP-N-acetylglucosamine--N-acetylmuramyl-(pentapeptide) pyrophosphoryl-undecaprenol N-acetylglucosamine transferase